jgi:hypothetical protein
MMRNIFTYHSTQEKKAPEKGDEGWGDEGIDDESEFFQLPPVEENSGRD